MPYRCTSHGGFGQRTWVEKDQCYIGADWFAKIWAKGKPELEGQRFECKADWKTHGAAAGPLRNSRMLEWKPDLVVAFPDPESTGTWDMVRKAKEAGVETLVHEVP